MFAVRYGYRLDDFYALTLRQIIQIKRVIEKGITETREWEAALHDKKIKASPKPLDIRPEEQKEYDTQAQKLLERMKRQHEQGSRIINKN